MMNFGSIGNEMNSLIQKVVGPSQFTDIESFRSLQGIIIKQDNDWQEFIRTCCVSLNGYKIYASYSNIDEIGPNQVPIMKIKETNHCSENVFCGKQCRAFQMDSTVMSQTASQVVVRSPREDQILIKMEKSCTCTFLCLGRPTVQVYEKCGLEQKLIGSVIQPFECCPSSVGVALKDPFGNIIFRIESSISQKGWKYPCCFCMACQQISFDILDSSGVMVGSCWKMKATVLRTCKGKIPDWLRMNFPEKATPQQKVLIMAAGVFIEREFFQQFLSIRPY